MAPRRGRRLRRCAPPRTQRIQDRTRQAHADARACARPRPWRFDHEPTPRPEPKDEHGQAGAAHRRRASRSPAKRAMRRIFRSPIRPIAFLVTSAIAKGRIDRDRPRRGARLCPACSKSSTTRTAGDLKEIKYRPAAAVRRRRSRISDPRSSMAARSSRIVVAETFEAAREAAHRVHVTYRCGTAERDLRRPGRGRSRQGHPSRQGCAAGRRCRGRLQRRGGQARRRICDADPASQSDRTLHHDLRLARRRVDDL